MKVGTKGKALHGEERRMGMEADRTQDRYRLVGWCAGCVREGCGGGQREHAL